MRKIQFQKMKSSLAMLFVLFSPCAVPALADDVYMWCGLNSHFVSYLKDNRANWAAYSFDMLYPKNFTILQPRKRDGVLIGFDEIGIWRREATLESQDGTLTSRFVRRDSSGVWYTLFVNYRQHTRFGHRVGDALGHWADCVDYHWKG